MNVEDLEVQFDAGCLAFGLGGPCHRSSDLRAQRGKFVLAVKLALAFYGRQAFLFVQCRFLLGESRLLRLGGKATLLRLFAGFGLGCFAVFLP